MNGSGSKAYWVVSLKSVGNVDWREVMIKWEVVFKVGDILIGNWMVFKRNDMWVVTENGKDEDYFDYLEQAIKYCIEN